MNDFELWMFLLFLIVCFLIVVGAILQLAVTFFFPLVA